MKAFKSSFPALPPPPPTKTRKSSSKKRKEEERSTAFYCAPIDELEETLRQHLLSDEAQTCRNDPDNNWAFSFRAYGRDVTCGGLLGWLRQRYYPNYDDGRGKQRYGRTRIKGSSSERGIRVDEEIGAAVESPTRIPKDVFSAAILSEMKERGHTLQAAQVPVVVRNGGDLRMTKADLVTQHAATGELWLWEVKTGIPVGFYRTQKAQPTFSGALSGIPCVRLHVWFLQLGYTRKALLEAGVRISRCAVIQVYEETGRGLVLKIHEPPAWALELP
jgi:hypothetical protein